MPPRRWVTFGGLHGVISQDMEPFMKVWFKFSTDGHRHWS
jgi:hypothetical protein